MLWFSGFMYDERCCFCYFCRRCTAATAAAVAAAAAAAVAAALYRSEIILKWIFVVGC